MFFWWKSYQISCKSDYFDTSYLYSLCKSCPIYTTFVMIFIRKTQGIHRRHFHIHTIKNKELFYFLNRYRVIMDLRPSRRCGGLVPRGEDNTPQCPSNFMALDPWRGLNTIKIWGMSRVSAFLFRSFQKRHPSISYVPPMQLTPRTT